MMKRGKTVLSILFCLAAVVFLYVNGLSSAASAAVSPRSAEREGAHRSSPSEAAPPAEEDSVPMPGEGAVRDDRASASDARTMEGMVLGAAPAEAPEMKQGIYSLIQSIKATCKTADSVASASDAAHPTPSNQSDLFASASDAAHPIPFDPQKNNIRLDIRLEYSQGNRTYQIKKDDRLSIQLVPEAYEKDFLTLDYLISQKKTLEENQVVVADLDMEQRRGIEFRFRGLQNGFRAEIQLPFRVKEDKLWRYFDEHPGETAVSFTYRLEYNGKDTGKAFTLRLQRPKSKDPSKQFVKTSGAYERSSQEKLGKGHLRYNIKLGTTLGPFNEFLIYDTPDVNLSFDGNLSLYRPRNPGMFEGKLIIQKDQKGHYLEPGTEPDDTKMEIWIYDIYYLTGEPSSPTEPRQADYEDVEHFDLKRKDPNGHPVTSMEAVTLPKNILVKKPMGEALTEEEAALIRDKGGLYQTVGKGFQIRLKNFKGNGRASGGYLFLNYTMTIRNNSPKFGGEQRLPIYLNTASYYGQEIPACTEGQQNCIPIRCEHSTMEDIRTGAYTTWGRIDSGVINVQIDRYHSVDFKKVEMNAEGNPDENKPLSGARFNIYRLSNNGAKREIASNNEGVLLKDLVTNGDGRLCRKTPEGSLIPLTLTLERGVYVFEEQAAPEGFERNSGETNVSVGFMENKVRVGNSRKGNEKEHPGGGNPGGGNPGGENPGGENPGGGSHAGGDRRSGGSGGHGGSGVIQKGTLPRGPQEAETPPSREASQESSQKFLRVSPAGTASVSVLPDRSGNRALPRTGESRPQLLWKHILPFMLLSLMLRLLWRLRAKDRRTGR